MANVNYPSYRLHARAVKDANNAIMALFVGAQLASRTLTLTEGSRELLSDIFPAVPHIKRLQLTAGAATKLIEDAESHLANLAVPQALALHESYVSSIRDLLLHEGYPVPLLGLNWNAENMHKIVFTALGSPVPQMQELFDLLRRIRNVIIHSGGAVDSYMTARIPDLSTQAKGKWSAVVGSPASSLSGASELQLGLGEIMLAFSITRFLDVSLNQALASFLPRPTWAAMVVEDYRENQPAGFKQTMKLSRILTGYGKHHYRPLGLTAADFRAPALAIGVSSTRL